MIAGAPGNDQAAVDKAIHQLPDAVQSRVVRLGSVENALKSRLLTSASVLAYPSLDEGFGFPLLEAQQVGLPVVASTAGSIPEVAGSAALYSAPTDVDALAGNLHLAITSETVRTKLINQGHRNLERFSWASTADQLTQQDMRLPDAEHHAPDQLPAPPPSNRTRRQTRPSPSYPVELAQRDS